MTPGTSPGLWRSLAHHMRQLLRSRHVPIVRQLAATDCGLACLTSVIQFHGRYVTIGDVRERIEAGRDGLTADALVRASELFGLSGRGVALDIDQLADLPAGAILHWSFTHYVVLNRVSAKWIEVMDPANGRRRVPIAVAKREFTGVALIFEPGPEFEFGRSRRKALPPLLLSLLLDRELLPHIVVASLVVQLLAIVPSLLTRTVIDNAIPLGSSGLLAIVAAAVAVCVGYSYWVQFVRAALMVHLRNRVDSRLSQVFLNHLLALPFEFFQRRTAGDLTMRLSSGSAIRELLSSAVLSFFLDGSLFVSYLILLLWLAPHFAAVALSIALVQIVTALLTAQKRADLSAALLQASVRTSSYQLEVVTGIESVKASGLERLAAEHWLERLNSELNVSLEKGLFDARVEAFGTGLRQLTPIAILMVGAVNVINGRLSLGEMIAYSAICNALLAPTSSLLANLGRFALLETHVERLNDVLDAKREGLPNVLHSPAISGRVGLQGVSFRYGLDGPWVLKDISTTIAPGEFIGVVGRSGSGKSTLVRLLGTLYQPTEGVVKFDNSPADAFVPSALRQQLGIVTQSTSLFGLTIRENITGADPEIGDDDIHRAARIACIHDDIMQMPMGYNTLLIDRGASLSGGQRQRLAIARAVLRRPRILVLDEATSHLDSVTEAAVTRQIRSLDCTVVMIAHRLSTVIDANRLIVLEHGRKVDEANHDTLLARCAVYGNLVAAQIGAEVPGHSRG